MANDRFLLAATSMPELLPATRLSTSPATKKPRFVGTRHNLPPLTLHRGDYGQAVLLDGGAVAEKQGGGLKTPLEHDDT